MLEGQGHEVTLAHDGHEAWKVMTQADSPRLVLLDARLPGMLILEVCRRIRARDGARPSYIIVFADRDDPVLEELEGEADDFVASPLGHVEVRARIAAAEKILGMQDQIASQVEGLPSELVRVAEGPSLAPHCS
jgi:sigma-B regulation protein RsbU (phosphoserine phosphatase)